MTDYQPKHRTDVIPDACYCLGSRRPKHGVDNYPPLVHAPPPSRGVGMSALVIATLILALASFGAWLADRMPEERS